MSVSAIPSLSALNPPVNLPQGNSLWQTEFQKLTQALQSGLSQTAQVSQGQAAAPGKLENATAITRPAHHHRPHHHSSELPAATSGSPGQTGGLEEDGTGATFAPINLLA
jgi:hypothetical protein